MTTLSMASWHVRGRELFPGVLACAVVATSGYGEWPRAEQFIAELAAG